MPVPEQSFPHAPDHGVTHGILVTPSDSVNLSSVPIAMYIGPGNAVLVNPDDTTFTLTVALTGILIRGGFKRVKLTNTTAQVWAFW